MAVEFVGVMVDRLDASLVDSMVAELVGRMAKVDLIAEQMAESLDNYGM